MSTDLAVPAGTDVEALEALLEQQEGEFGADVLTVPILKIGQALTNEVKAEQAEAGEFINSLTGEGLGDKIGFIVSYYQQGRFAATDEGKAFVAFSNTIPDQWEPLVGKDWVGEAFADYPEAEEQFKAAVNAKEREWGKGPLVSTTHNFTGYAIVPGLDAEDEETLIPVRLSLKRTDVPAAKKLISLKKMLRLKAFWDLTFDLSTSVKSSGRYESYIVNVKAGRPTTEEEKLLAVTLAQDVAGSRVRDNSAAEVEGEAKDRAAAAEAPEGALGV